MSINSEYYGFSTEFELAQKQAENAVGTEWEAYQAYIVERMEHWITKGNQEWPNAIEPKAKSIDSLAHLRATQEAMEKFGVTYVDIGNDAEGRYL